MSNTYYIPSLDATLATYCNITYPNSQLPTFPRTRTLVHGTSFAERDILETCCKTHDITTYLDANKMACAVSANCPVKDCNAADPAVACVGLIREQWRLGGAFGCEKGVENGSGILVLRRRVWVVVGVVMVVVVGGLGN